MSEYPVFPVLRLRIAVIQGLIFLDSMRQFDIFRQAFYRQ